MAVLFKFIEKLAQQIIDLKSNLNPTFQIVNYNRQSPALLPSYADALLANTAKATVSQAMQKQQQDITNKTYVVNYGFQKKNNDQIQLQELF